jgi:ParB family chromosome partitioning protein
MSMAEETHRSRLGRGLAALIGDAGAEPAAERGGRAQRRVPVAFLKPNPRNPRRMFSETELDELATSIRERGIIQPIVVRTARGSADSFEIIAGERRWRAAQRAGLHDVPIIVHEASDSESLELAIIENVQRADLNVIEEAAAYQELIDRFGRTQEQIAQDVGKSRPHIANTIRLLRLPDSVKALVQEGKLTAGHARTLLNVPDPEAAAWDILSGKMTVRQAEQRTAKKRKPGGKVAKDPNIADLEASISNRLGLKIQIIHKGDKGGEVRISYTSLEQMDEITRRLSRS